MTITAKYAATCPCCNSAITPGQKIEWSKGSKARHVACATGSAPAVAPKADRYTGMTQRQRRAGKWTGCSCGSREDSYGDLIPSPRNCRSCEHDA